MIQPPQPSLEAFFRTFNIQDFAVSPNEKQIVFSTNIGGRYNLWAIDTDRGYPYPLTRQDQMASFIRYLPDGDTLLTGFDNDGDENWQMYALSTKGGELAPLLVQAGEKFYFGDLSADGRHLYFSTSVGNPRYHNINRLDLATTEACTLIEGKDGPLAFLEVSPDESSFAYQEARGNTTVLGLIRQGETTISVTPDSQSPHKVRRIRYWDSEAVYVLTNFGEEFTYLARYSLVSGSFQKIAAVAGHDFVDLRLDRRGNQLYLTASRGVQDRLFRYNLITGSLDELSAPTSVINKIIVGESGQLYLLGRSAVQPANLYCSSNGASWQAITDHRIMGLTETELSDPEVLSYPSYDGRMIEALFFPPSAERDNGHTVLWPHGGPQAAERKSFRPLIQYLCQQGYRVFAPNYRGSSGYGETFMNLVNKDWGGGPRLDIVAGIEWLNQQGKAQAGKWFCVGGSYGGYMTLLLHGRHPDLFKAFVDQFGPSNLFTTIETAPEHWKTMDAELIGDPIRDREKLLEDSPMTYLENMSKPMLVVQGVNDPRVVKKESDVIVEALREKGQDVEYVVLPDEGHGYSKTENAIRVYKAIVEFLNRYL